MSGFTRRFSYFPDATTIREIEGVIIVDTAPSSGVQGADSGTVFLVGEFEDGGFATDPRTPADAYHPEGGPILIPRDKMASTVGTMGHTINGTKNQHPCARMSLGEAWNGNGYVQSRGLAFRKLYAVRVDTSVGSVAFAPLAYLESSVAAPWALTTGQTIVAAVNGAADVTATFTGAVATVTGGAGTPGSVVAGDYVDLAIDDGKTIRVTFGAADVTFSLQAAAINRAFGAPIASVATYLVLTSPTGGTASKVVIVGGTAVTKLGHAAGTTSGTGNVANIGAVTAAEAIVVLAAGLTGSAVRSTSAGKLRIASATGSTGTIRVQAGSTATAFGFTTATTKTVAECVASATSIPAGTLLSDGGAAASRVVTMQTVNVPKSTTLLISVKVRPATDDGTYAGLSASSIDTIETTISSSSEFAVTQAASLSGALTEAQKDAAYLAALDKTKAITGPSRKASYIVSARQSSAIRLALKQNAIDSSSVGYGRKAIIAPPLGTSLATMTGSSAPGVGAYRHERVAYALGWRKLVPEIAAQGTAGGVGFNDTGLVEVHGDIVLASLCSLLNPEENPAQSTDLLPAFYVDVESAVADWGVDSYKAAKAAGIVAPIMVEGEGAQFQSGVTSVDPSSSPSQVPLSRIRLADFLTDSVADFQAPYVKKLGTKKRKDQLLGKLDEFLEGLEKGERIDSYTVTEGVAPARRTFVLQWKVEPLDSLDHLINETTIGEGAIETQRKGA